MFTHFHLKMYILISSLTTSMTLPKCVKHVWNFSQPWHFVRVSLTGVCRSMGSCLVYCNVHVQTCLSFTHLKRCWEDFPTPPSLPKRNHVWFTAHLWSCTVCFSWSIYCLLHQRLCLPSTNLWFLCKWDKKKTLKGKIHHWCFIVLTRLRSRAGFILLKWCSLKNIKHQLR